MRAFASSIGPVFLALPHGASAAVGKELADRGTRVCDLGSDYRFGTPEGYAAAYGHEHPIPAELGAEAAVEVYEPVVQEALPFDLVILGMGEDGHTASLFPGHSHAGDALVLAVHEAPKPPPDRVSLSQGALSDARQVLILVTGGGKRDAVQAWKAGDTLPVASIRGHNGVDVLIDRDAVG